MNYRLYGLVAYQLNGGQMMVQFSHAVEQYIKEFGNTEEYQQRMSPDGDLTTIVLNGGTTCDVEGKEGSLQEHIKFLEENGIKYAVFKEPDLNMATLAVAFLLPQSVYDSINYPNIYEQYEINTAGIVFSHDDCDEDSDKEFKDSINYYFNGDEKYAEKCLSIRDYFNELPLAKG